MFMYNNLIVYVYFVSNNVDLQFICFFHIQIWLYVLGCLLNKRYLILKSFLSYLTCSSFLLF